MHCFWTVFDDCFCEYCYGHDYPRGLKEFDVMLGTLSFSMTLITGSFEALSPWPGLMRVLVCAMLYDKAQAGTT